MKMKLISAVAVIALSATVMSASAQKAYTAGTITFKTTVRGQDVEAKEYFTADSIATSFTAGPATIKILANSNHTSMAILVEVPVASIKKAAIMTPDEIDQSMAGAPTFTFTPTAETKQISGYNCKKIQAKDNKTGTSYDVWVTNDISVPTAALPPYYKTIGSFPVQYTQFQQGQSADVTVTSVTDQKAPAGTFAIGSDFDKITMDDLKSMGGGK